VNVLAPNSEFTVASGATLGVNSFNPTIGSLAGAGSATLGRPRFRGSGIGGLPKIGAGTRTYSGGTTLAVGTLSLANNRSEPAR
jgi:hypothetical protein